MRRRRPPTTWPPVRPAAGRRTGPARAAVVTAAVLAALAAAALPAAPAAAAGAADDGTYRSVVLAVEPEVDGLDVEVAGDRVRVSYDGDATVVVLGYADEEFLRLTPDGAERNAASVTAALSVGSDLRSLPADAAAARWEPLPEGEVGWQDLRTRWVAAGPPPNVAAGPDAPHRVSTWAIPLMVDGAPAVLRGAVEWSPGGGVAWGWVVAGVLAALVAVGGATAAALRPRRARRRGRAVAAARVPDGGPHPFPVARPSERVPR